MRNKSSVHGLYAIADTQYLTDAFLPQAVEQAIEGGAKVIQYRDKRGTPAGRATQVAKLKQICRTRGAGLIINDDIDLAAEVGAQGVHLGREDASLTEARARLGAQAIIGVSCYNELERARAAQADGADYVAFGSFFPSRTKPNAARATPELLRQARKVIRIPIVAIGGITPENGASLIAAGADSLAVIEGIFNQPDIRSAARDYARLFTDK